MIELNMILSGFLIGVTFIISILAYYSNKRKEVPGAKGLNYLCIAASFYTFGYAMELMSTTIESINIWSKIQYIGLPFIPALWVYLTVSYIQKKPHSRSFYFFLFIVPLFTSIFRWTSEWHHLQYGAMSIVNNGYFNVLAFEKGPWYYFHFFYLFICAMYTSVFYFKLHLKSSGYVKQQSIVMLWASFIPIVSILSNLTGRTPLQLDSGPFFILLAYVILAYGIFRYRLMNIIPLSREKVFDWISDGVIVTDLQMNILDFNPSAEKIFPLLTKESLDHQLEMILTTNPKFNAAINRWREASVRELDATETELIHIHIENDDESTSHYQMRMSNIFDSGLHVGRILIVNDTTEQHKMLMALEKLARTDKLTGLYNRGHFVDLFNARFNDKTLLTANELLSDLRIAVMMFDIDHFKKINDTFGHSAGDLVLKRLSDHVHKSLRHGESVCRYGGEEFVILLSETTLEEAQKVAERLRHEIETLDIVWEGKRIAVTASFGLTYYELLKTSQEDPSKRVISFEQLVNQADKAMYLAKANGRNCVETIL